MILFELINYMEVVVKLALFFSCNQYPIFEILKVALIVAVAFGAAFYVTRLLGQSNLCYKFGLDLKLTKIFYCFKR